MSIVHFVELSSDEHLDCVESDVEFVNAMESVDVLYNCRIEK